jgi:hypothetical protein
MPIERIFVLGISGGLEGEQTQQTRFGTFTLRKDCSEPGIVLGEVTSEESVSRGED